MIPGSTLILIQDTTAGDRIGFTPVLTLAAAIVATGLAAGVFYTFQISIVSALKEVDDDAYVATFQAINRRIQNAGFLVTFLGAPLLIVAALVAWWGEDGATAVWIGAGLALQIASLAVTIGGNIPLNNALDRAGTVSGPNATATRFAFEGRWNRLHAIRTIASIGSFVALAAAAVTAMW
jgi:uncharacterized membrane protein